MVRMGMWTNPVCELADDDSASEFGGRQSSGSRGTPTGQQWQGAPRESSVAAARCGGSFQPLHTVCCSVDVIWRSTQLSRCFPMCTRYDLWDVCVQCVVRGARNKRRRTFTATAKKKMLQSKPLLNSTPHTRWLCYRGSVWSGSWNVGTAMVWIRCAQCLVLHLSATMTVCYSRRYRDVHVIVDRHKLWLS
jgi:hypothetical protein